MERNAVSPRTKLLDIMSFCKSYGYAVENHVRNIIEHLDDLPDKLISLIDVFWKAANGLDSNAAKKAIVIIMTLLGSTLKLLGLAFSMVGIAGAIVSVLIVLLKITFSLINFKTVLRPTTKAYHPNWQQFDGLAERLKNTSQFIDSFEDQIEKLESLVRDFISNNIAIGVQEIGSLKGNIRNLLLEEKKDWVRALESLTLFVKIYTLRHSLLFKLLTYSETTESMSKYASLLKKHMHKEREDNKTFLSSFFYVPSLENVGILATFDPYREKELDAYLKELCVTCQNLSEDFHGKSFRIQPFLNPSIYCGRPFPSFSSVRSMTSLTGIGDVRINFRFTAIKDEFNLFYIQSPDVEEYVYMKENSYCKYKKMFYVPTNAQWRVILVTNDDRVDHSQSLYVLCTKKWPEKILYVERSFFECTKGLQKRLRYNKDCLFTVRQLLYIAYYSICKYLSNNPDMLVTVFDLDFKNPNRLINLH